MLTPHFPSPQRSEGHPSASRLLTPACGSFPSPGSWMTPNHSPTLENPLNPLMSPSLTPTLALAPHTLGKDRCAGCVPPLGTELIENSGSPGSCTHDRTLGGTLALLGPQVLHLQSEDLDEKVPKSPTALRLHGGLLHVHNLTAELPDRTRPEGSPGPHLFVDSDAKGGAVAPLRASRLGSQRVKSA